MIYIDPPYNTGNDFVYDDDFTEPLQEYLRRTGQVDEEGKTLTTNKRSDGRFHSKWLSMMYPRLRLARNLLRDDGLIFVSIDDNEIANLRLMMNEIFGEENYQQQITWKNKYGPGALTKGFGNLHEYILCYSRNNIESITSKLSDEDIQNYKLKDDKYELRGGYITQPLATKSKDDRPNLVYPLIHEGKEIWPDKQWIWSKERLQKAYDNGEVIIKENNGKFSVRFKQYLKDEDGKMRMGKPLSLMNGPFNQDGTKEIDRLFGKPVFDFPKPVELIKYLFSMVVNEDVSKDGIYLDFFAGSGSSNQALLELNEEDSGNRSIITIQIPEPIDPSKTAYKEGFTKISDVTKERSRKVISQLKKKQGFKNFKLNYSNYKPWINYHGNSLDQLLIDLEQFNNIPLRENWTKDGLLTEILLLEGFTLCSNINSVKEIKSNTIKKVSSEYCQHHLLVCLDEAIKKETIEVLSLGDEDIFICLDSAISTEDKLRLSDKGLIKTI
jgi:adenine-specific DNA-methyltransferase